MVCSRRSDAGHRDAVGREARNRTGFNENQITVVAKLPQIDLSRLLAPSSGPVAEVTSLTSYGHGERLNANVRKSKYSWLLFPVVGLPLPSPEELLPSDRVLALDLPRSQTNHPHLCPHAQRIVPVRSPTAQAASRRSSPLTRLLSLNNRSTLRPPSPVDCPPPSSPSPTTTP